MKERRLLILLAVFVVVLALQVLPLYAVDWQPIYEGVDYCLREKTSPRLMKAFALRIDLHNPSVSFLATPGNGSAPYETNLQTTPNFRAAYGLAAAVNANFSVLHSPYSDVEGVLVSNGSYVSYDQAYRQAQLRLTADKVASIVGSGGNPSGFHTIVSGDAYHLVNGNPLGDNSWLAPRTSLGVSQDGRYLFWCVVDGRQPGWSEGATILDMSYWMLDLGAYNAINVDGGGSSCLCSASGGVYNRPSDGSPRAVGANLGVYSTTIRSVDACSMNSNRIDIAVRGANNNVYVRTWTTSGGWGGWTNLGGTTYDDPAIVSRANGYLEVFCRGANNELYHNWNNGSGWSGWFSLGGSIVSAPNVCVRYSGNMEVVARWSDNTIRKIAYDPSTGWGGWDNHGGSTNDAPAIISRAPGYMEIFYRGTDDQLYHQWWDVNTGWSGHYSLGGSMRSGPAVVSRNSNHMEVFCRGANGGMEHIYWDGYQWSPWISEGGVTTSEPGATVLKGTETMKTYTRDTNGVVYCNTWTPSTGWSGFISQGFAF